MGCERLELDVNKFEGSIPDAVASWKVLEEVNIAHNMFSGVVPGAVKHGHQLERQEVVESDSLEIDWLESH